MQGEKRSANLRESEKGLAAPRKEKEGGLALQWRKKREGKRDLKEREGKLGCDLLI